MSEAGKVVTWVVYRMTLPGRQAGVNAVCEQGEWDALELSRPGYHTLVRSGIATEGEAERIAREGQGGVDAAARPGSQ